MSSNITIEKLDAVIQRVPNATYADAKNALMQADGDVIEAIMMLESKNAFSQTTSKVKKNVEQVFSKDSSELKEDFKDMTSQVKEILKRSSVIRLIIEKNGKVIINIPLTVGVAGLALGTVYTLLGLSAAMLSKYNILIQNEEDGSVVNLGQLSEEKLNMLKDMITNTAKDVKDVVVDNKKEENQNDAKDITDELIKEDEVEAIVLDIKKKD